MSFPKYQGNYALKGIRGNQSELRKLEKPASDATAFMNKPADNVVPPPCNTDIVISGPTPVTPVSIQIHNPADGSNTRNSGQIFLIVDFTGPVDPATLPTSFQYGQGILLAPVGIVWSDSSGNQTQFTGQVAPGEISGNWIGSNTFIVDYSGVQDLTGASLQGDTEVQTNPQITVG